MINASELLNQRIKDVSQQRASMGYDPTPQFKADTAAISAFVKANNISATKDASGIFYQILAPGSGSVVYAASTKITSDYEGKLLNGTVFDSTNGNPISLTLGNVIVGWQIGIEAKDLDAVTNAIAVGDTYVGAGSFDALYIPTDGQIYTPAVYARVTYPSYTRTEALQCRQSEEFLVIATTVRLLVKNASPAPFQDYITESVNGIQQLIQDGVYTQSMSANS